MAKHLPSKSLALNFIDQQIDYLCTHLSKALQLLPNHEGVVYRGAQLTEEDLAPYTEGSTITMTRFTGASETYVNVLRFIQSKVDYVRADQAKTQPVVFNITSKKVRSISDFSFMPGEKEVLFAPGTKFRVTSRKYTDKYLQINLEEV